MGPSSRRGHYSIGAGCADSRRDAAVHHAEVVAHRVGEPFGTLILALSVTVIEVALIVTIMLSGGTAANALVRDTVFATVMIVCNGVVGLCLLLGAIRHHVLVFRVDGTGPPLSVLAALTTLTLILPTLTITTPGPTLSPAQLVFAGVMSLALYSVFVFVQTVRHRDYFLPVVIDGEEQHVTPPTTSVALSSLGFLLISLFAVIGLAKALSPIIKAGVQAASAPAAVVGHRHRAIGASTGGMGGVARGYSESHANQPEPCARVCTGDHRTDHSLGRGRFDCI